MEFPWQRVFQRAQRVPFLAFLDRITGDADGCSSEPRIIRFSGLPLFVSLFECHFEAGDAAHTVEVVAQTKQVRL